MAVGTCCAALHRAISKPARPDHCCSRSYKTMGRYEEAAEAYGKAEKVIDDDPDLLASTYTTRRPCVVTSSHVSIIAGGTRQLGTTCHTCTIDQFTNTITG